MNLEAISQFTFSDQLAMPATQTADRALTALPSGVNRAPRWAAVPCTDYLGAHLESLCINELQRDLDVRRPAGVVRALLSDDGNERSSHAANVGSTSDQ